MAKLHNFVPFQHFPSLWIIQVFLSSASSALLTLLHPNANTTIFTVLSWWRLNYTEVASFSLRICVKTIVFLSVSSGISSCNSRTPAGWWTGSTAWRGVARGWWRVPAPSLHTQGTSDGAGCVCMCKRGMQGAQKQMQRRGRLAAGMPDHTEQLWQKEQFGRAPKEISFWIGRK